MSELVNSENEFGIAKIDILQKILFVAKAREKAPLTTQEIDETGTYLTSYNHRLGIVDIYMPTLANPDTDDDLMLMPSEALAVCIREVDTVDDRYTIYRTRSYILYLETDMSEFNDSHRIYDNETDKWIEGIGSQRSLKELQEYQEVQNLLGVEVFTQKHFDEVYAVLEELDQKDSN